MKKVFLCSLLFLFGLVPNVNADFVLYEEGNWWDVVTAGEWGSASLDYSVFFDADTNQWKYVYDFDADSRKNISHVITEVSGNFETVNILDGTTAGYDLDKYSEELQGNSNPGFPYEIRGLKWNPGELGYPESDVWEWIIISNRSPMDGLVYTVDGKKPGDINWAYGTARVPDTIETPIPEPGTMLLVAFGLIGLARFGRKKFKK